MQLKRLIIQGFKSFKDRTVIHFNKGVTGIVGPNGCGKSNIVDALFWVMGEQSARHLRGQSMKDLIFSGSDLHGPSMWAEVSLILGNERRRFIRINSKTVDPVEIQLSRKLYRNGETEYRINNIPCRLKDIQEVFMDTGAGAKSYSIIAQGEVERLVQAKPEERRVMIEEVAGITKFKARKKESWRKIEQTQANLNRLNDLKTEVEKGLHSLKKQAAQAKEAKELKQKIKDGELVITSHQEHRLLSVYQSRIKQWNDKKQDVFSWKTQKNILETERQKEDVEYTLLTKEMETLQQDYHKLSNELAALEERKIHLGHNKAEKESFMESKKEELTDIDRELSNKKAHLKQLENQCHRYENQSDKSDNSPLLKTVASLKEKIRQREEDLKEKKEDIETLKEKMSQIDHNIHNIVLRSDESRKTLDEHSQEKSSLESQYSYVLDEVKKDEESLQSKKDILNDLIQKERQLELSINQLEERKDNFDHKYREKYEQSLQINSTISSLTELNHSLEDISKEAGSFLESTQSEGYQVLGNLIQCEKTFAKAVGRLLEHISGVLLTQDKKYKNYLSWRDTRKSGRIHLMTGFTDKNEEDLSSELSRAVNGGKLIPLHRLVRIKDGFELRPLLQGLYVADRLDINSLMETTISLDFKMIASLNGDIVIKKEGNAFILQMAGSEPYSGLIERNNKIEQLSIDKKKVQEEIQKISDENSGVSVQLEKIKKEFDEVVRLKMQTRADLMGLESVLNGKKTGIRQVSSRLETLERKRQTLTESIDKMKEEKSSLEKSNKDNQILLREKQKSLVNCIDELKTIRVEYEWERELLLEQQARIKNIDQNVSLFTDQINVLKQEILQKENLLEKNNNLILQLRKDIELIEEDSTQLLLNNQKKSTLIQEKGNIIESKKKLLNDLLHKTEKKKEEIASLNNQIVDADKKLIQLEENLKHNREDEARLVRDIFEKYKINLRDSLADYLKMIREDLSHLEQMDMTQPLPYRFQLLDKSTLKERKKDLNRFRSQYAALGDVNFQAIDSYDMQKDRFDFLSSQEKELLKSIEDLEKAIAHIDEKSKSRFQHAFKEVQKRFEQVFPIIFGGGQGRLSIIGEIDDPECGVDIIARPPGKKMRSINLMSGGEKALTAVALIFSIFLVKPSPFCLLDEVDAPLDDANVGRFNELLREISNNSQFILITHNKQTMELNDTLYGVTMQEPGISKAVSVELHQ